MKAEQRKRNINLINSFFWGEIPHAFHLWKKSTMNLNEFFEIAGMIFLAFALTFLFSFVLALVLMIAWNLVIPFFFDLEKISFWTAWGILILLGFVGGTLGGIFGKNDK
jgi:hypothetical protein